MKVSDEVYEMLRLLKPSSSTSFNDVIFLLIDLAAPYLAEKVSRLKKLEEEDPKKAIAERVKLKKYVYIKTVSELYRDKYDLDNERAIDELKEQQEREEEPLKETFGQEKKQSEPRGGSEK